MDPLTAAQRAAVQQLRDLTAATDDDVAASVLATVDWDVQRAAELIFDNGAPPPRTQTPVQLQPFDIDDTAQAIPRPRPARPSALAQLARPLLTLLALPLHVLGGLVRLLLSVLRIPLPSLPLRLGVAGLFSRPLGGHGHGLARGGPARWVRELEEETGAVCGGAPVAFASGVDAPRGAADDGRRALPDFALCTYEEFLRTCAREARIGCAVLVSAEHDDVAAFKRSTLTDPAFVRLLTEHNILVWGGDVRDHDAWSAAEKLQATTYPFVAFLALQPRRTPGPTRASPAPPALTVLSRHAGPATPAASAPTSATVLTTHLTTQLLPRVTPFLGRIAAAQREREAERALRAAQDSAFASAQQRDAARIRRAMDAERTAREAAAAEAQRAAEEARRVAEEARDAAAQVEARMAWRRWARRALASPSTTGAPTKIAIRLPAGGRVIQSFSTSATLTTLYAAVDAALVPADLDPADDPASPPTPTPVGHNAEAVLEAHVLGKGQAYWGFTLASAYPRTEIAWAARTPLAGVAALRGGGQVVVELASDGRRRSAEKQAAREAEADDDGYDTEESE